MDDDEDEFVFLGTPLPEIEDEAVLKKKAAKELQVRDEKGRQRFHGAFTGGFSAGYFNSVGTKEGWAPSTFISSRCKISERIQQNPEDFMDDEDFGEFGIATRKIHTTSNFQDTSSSNSKKRKFIDTETAIPGEAPLKDIVQPVRESIGIAILKKLGWRQGQGIGPRVKKHNSGVKVYSCSPFPDSAVPEEEDDPMFAAYTFAPKDIEGISFKPKDNYFGLGYSGLSKQSVLQAAFDPFAPTSTKSWLAKDKKKIAISGQAFGVGAFEDDDEDIYGKDDMSQYDFSDLTLTGTKNSEKVVASSKSGLSQGVLEGFLLASQPSFVKKHYPPPVLPASFKPIMLKLVPSVSKDINAFKPRHSLSAPDRSLLLGEKKFQKTLPSVPISTAKTKAPDNIVPKTFVNVASTSSLNFRPFPSDLNKQQRYEEYLKLRETGGIERLVQPSDMTEWERQQEIEEFNKAAVLFKPLSNVLSSRFESRSHLSVEHEVMAELQKIKSKEEKEVTVKKNLVGTHNRTTVEWHPVPLLCKRMNVQNPYPNSDSSETQSILKTKSMFDNLSFTKENTNSPFENKTQEASEFQKVPDTYLHIPDKVTEPIPPEDKRPPMDFFKDIFENSSSDDETTTEEKANTSDKLKLNSEKEISSLNNQDSDKQVNISSPQRTLGSETDKLNQNTFHGESKVQNSSSENKKAGFGVFANLDLDALNRRKPIEKPFHQTLLKSENKIIEIDLTAESCNDASVKESTVSDDLYGPELPPNFSNHSPISASNSYKISPRKHTKHKSKHKRHKHKSKKKKKSSKRDSSCSDSTDELDDIPPSLIIEKMKKLQKRKS